MFSKSTISMIAAALAISAPLAFSSAARADEATAAICGGKITGTYQTISFYVGQDQRYTYTVILKNNTGAQLTYSVRTGWQVTDPVNLHGQKLAPAGEVTITLGRQTVSANPRHSRAPATAADLARTTIASCY